MATVTYPRDKFAEFIAFDPSSQRAVNWVHSFLLWLFAIWAGGICYVVRAPHMATHTPTDLVDAVVYHTPLITDLIWLAAILAFATGFRTLRVNRALRWSGAAPISFRLLGRQFRPHLVTQIAFFAAAGFCLLVLQRYLVAALGGPVTRQHEAHAASPVLLQAFALSAVFIAPLAEELLYRGVLFIQAYGVARKAAATVISSSLFALVHIEQYSSRAGEIHYGAISSIFALGLACCLSRAATDRVWPAFVIHTAYNLSVGLAYYLG